MTQTLFPHINHALVPKTHPSMYLTHKYWARKPHNVVAEYIEHYSKTDEIVLDPFVGSGVTLLEALRIGRRAIGFDLDPLSILTMQVTAESIDVSKFDQAFDSIKADLESEINQLYKFPCPSCKKQSIITYVVWSYIINCPICKKRVLMAEVKRPKGKRQNIYKCLYCKQEFSYANVPIMGEQPIFLRAWCPNCKQVSKVNNPELELPTVQLSNVWYPKIRFSYNEDRPFTTKRRANTIEELFTERNLYALALLHARAVKIEDEVARRAILFVFSSMVPQASRLVPWRRGFLTGGPAWTVPEYLILPVHCEFNVWSRFENRFHSMRRGIENRNECLPPKLEYVESFDELQNRGQYLIDRINAIELSSVIPPNSVDYVFTDPPYGGAIQYFELDLIRVAWLLGKENGDVIDQWWKEEITINRGQEKNFEYYHKMLSASFSEIYKVLKPGRFLTVTFHSTDIDVWNSIIMAVRLAGFELEKIIYQPPAVRSAKASLQPYGSAVGDYYIRFRKAERERAEGMEEHGDSNKYRRVVIETAKRIIAQRVEATPFTFILNGIIPELDKQGVFFVDKRGSKGIEEVLKDRLNIDFILKPIVDKAGNVIGQGWWFKDPSSIPYLETTPLSERVEKLVINILNNRVKVSFDDVLQEVFITFPNALTPNTQSVKEVLEEYASRTPDKKWMLKPKFKERMNEHDIIVKNLADLGTRFDFSVHADIDSYRKASFPFDVENQDRVKNIDVIWYSGKQAVAIFEIENTTGITEAIVRGGNIKGGFVLRVLVMPEERIRLIRRKVLEPILKEQIVKYDWRLLTYGELQTFLNKYKKKQPKLDWLRARMVKLADFRREVQESIQKFV